ncbi:Hypothetical protein BCD_1134 (plasmid) [Borrelia crocidurae DOU]|uniref:BBG30-like protein n=1 Tax=Borrelia crocidurae DOU TaxID=1293575 RepID=W5SJW4_9SPIR|nr:hypothetical protein [Borrelia crocidurae]AHH07200.1 Hypothetical protein BCD_1134 [Borrelia crocidurae DOU]
MKFTLKYLIRRLYLRRDRFWQTYMSDEIQSKKNDETIVNFPILNSDDIDYEYVSSYVKEWINKKYTDNLDIKIQLVDNLYYNCEIRKYSLLAGFLETLHRDYKEIFLGNLERKKVVAPKIKLQPEDQSGEEKDQLKEKDQKDQSEEQVVQQDQAQVKAAKAKASKKPATKPEVVQS